MGFSILHNRSLDDSSLIDRRTRSTSPSKNRHSLPPTFFDMRLPHMPIANDEDIRSATSSSSSNLSQEHLKQLSKSPVSKRLHVATTGDTNKYVIPIPFTLSLPPKLSQKNIQHDLEKRSRSASPVRSPASSRHSSPPKSPSPSRSMSPCRRQTKLVYTSTGYKKLESLSDEDELTQDSINKRIAFNRRPPPLPAKKGKALKITFQPHSDELSIIEEASNSGASSRQSSVKSKPDDQRSLPPPPIEKEQQPIIAPLVPVPAQKPKPFLTNVRIMTTPNPRASPVTSIPKTKTELNLRTLQMQGGPTKGAELKIHKRSFSDESFVSSISSFSSVGDIMSFSKHPIQYRNLETSPVVRRLNELRGIQANDNDRIVSTSSTVSKTSDGSVASWDSLQSSIDIKSTDTKKQRMPEKLERKISLKPKARLKQLPPTPQSDDDWEDGSSEEEVSEITKDSFDKDGITSTTITETEDEDTSMSRGSSEDNEDAETFQINYSKESEEVEPLRISRASTLTGSDGLAGPHKLQKLPVDEQTIYDFYLDDIASISTAKYSEITTFPDEKQTTPDFDNSGAGRRFSFPNNRKNVTNSKAIQQQKLSGNSLKSSRSRTSFMSKSGQIEIPDLETDSYSAKVSYFSYNTKSANDSESDTSASNSTGTEDEESQLEPIGYPSKAAQNAAKEHFKSMYNATGDEDSDTDIESTKFSLYALRQQAKSTPNLKANRNKELPPIEGLGAPAETTNIPIASPPRRHQRHKSMYNIDFEYRESGSDFGKEITHKKSKSTDLSNLSTPTSGTHDQKAGNDGILAEESPESLDIVIADPPSQVQYEVDFKEADSNDGHESYDQSPNYTNEVYRSATIHSFPHRHVDDLSNQMHNLKMGHTNPRSAPGSRSVEEASYSSKSSFQSSNSAGQSSLTSISDNESVVIDLTKDNYDICMVNRQDSIHSYKSVTERTKDGKEVEVVLVDEDEDDLLSLYSKYRNDSWVFRTSSTSSRSSNFSAASFDSNTPSESQLSLKQRPEMIKRFQSTNSIRVPGDIAQDLGRKRSNISEASSHLSANYNSRRIQPPINGLNKIYSRKGAEPVFEKPSVRPSYTDSSKRHTVHTMDSNYFDYTSGDKYDFNTFMKQQSSNQI
ncbi:uncharacterized protein CANTADRAFT_23204 [Suhomyces tanzawaensis NRRL Y-17324]|uniref:Uncharacterized protein n=1 Tax=Suhomyces tanzawaensis NRRL Y-17324 TaxID=984487 RepID=A0A1E4SEY7_9ASCO|nr:uncharacterized protein CANTADRAFT_23204 [Suhomyces tanzawaensis NRRL Y-17324]ODV78099.1 hypothetical protein CANTADRAFT_23204 [Suhomyces tanzawaensis NRRL Y-17324]